MKNLREKKVNFLYIVLLLNLVMKDLDIVLKGKKIQSIH